jgi:hypothetical protein
MNRISVRSQHRGPRTGRGRCQKADVKAVKTVTFYELECTFNIEILRHASDGRINSSASWLLTKLMLAAISRRRR